MNKSLLAPTLIFSLMMIASNTSLGHSIKSPVDPQKPEAFDILEANATTDGSLITFKMEVVGIAGSQLPKVTGQLKGAKVNAYVWPTSLDPSVVGFDSKSGILALAITAHPDFDDTPLFDENNDGDPANDGKTWHSHWVVLSDQPLCGAGLTVRDITPGKDLLPMTAPGLPIALDSPGMSPSMSGHVALITVPVSDTKDVSFDAVTAELQVNINAEVPLLCVIGVNDVASGDLSLPGKVVTK